jgi:hypothetical protein
MKVCVIGAPKSGKTKFAKTLAKDKNLNLLDNLPQKYIKKTGLALGHISDYRVDMMFMGNILENEYKYKDEGYVITSSSLYTLAHFVFKANFVGDDDERMVRLLWPSALLNQVINDSLWYDEIYYLPYKGKDEINAAIDKAIRQVFFDQKINDRIIRVE